MHITLSSQYRLGSFALKKPMRIGVAPAGEKYVLHIQIVAGKAGNVIIMQCAIIRESKILTKSKETKLSANYIGIVICPVIITH